MICLLAPALLVAVFSKLMHCSVTSLRPAALALLLAALVGAAHAGCESRTTTDEAASREASAQRTLVVAIDIKGATELSDAAHDALKARILDALDEASAHRFIASETAEHSARAQLRFVMLPADGGEQQVRFTMMAELETLGGDAADEVELTTETLTERRADESREAMRERAAREAARSLAGALDAALHVQHADAAQLVAILGDPRQDEAVLLRAVHQAGRVRDARLAEPLRALLVHPSREVVLASLTMLGQLRDEASVGAIRELLTSPDVAKLEHALLALGEIGGREAEEILTSTARSHPDPAVRELATRMLYKMMNR